MPSLVPYKDVMKFTSEQKIGTLHNTPQASADSETEKESEDVVQNLLSLVPGFYINLQERLLQMVNLYLYIESHRPNFLTWFGKEKGHFLVAIGADGAPFGKANEACAWLVSFLNVLERVSSPYDNFLICGGNCTEDHPSMIEYGKLLRSQISILEKQVFTVKGHQVKFTFKLLPSDMKWLSKLSAELSNAATYPNPFVNVTLDDRKKEGITWGLVQKISGNHSLMISECRLLKRLPSLKRNKENQPVCLKCKLCVQRCANLLLSRNLDRSMNQYWVLLSRMQSARVSM